MICIDGSQGEGGGAIVRTALALSLATHKPCTITNIRQGRPKPGLKHQHLHAIRLIEALTDSHVDGAELAATSITFIPGHFSSFEAEVDTTTAASITLLLQAILPALITRAEAFRLRIIGGTDVAWSQPIDHFAHVLLPILDRLKPITCRVGCSGFYPKGGGVVELCIAKGIAERPIELTRFANPDRILILSKADERLRASKVAERQADAAAALLPFPCERRILYERCASPGSVITLIAASGLGADALGERGVRAEQVGAKAARQLRRLLDAGAACDEHSADALIPYLAIFGGCVRIPALTAHVRSNIDVVEAFAPGHIMRKDHELSAARLIES